MNIQGHVYAATIGTIQDDSAQWNLEGLRQKNKNRNR